MKSLDSIRSINDIRGSDTAAITTYTVYGLRHGGDVWLFGVQSGDHPLVDVSVGDAENTIWLCGVPYVRSSTVVDATDVAAAIQAARRQVLCAADLLCDRCQDGVATHTAPDAFNGQRWCRPCVDDHGSAADRRRWQSAPV